MKIRYFEETDTLYIELKDTKPIRTEELNDHKLPPHHFLSWA
jgi:uncharacterized protein YuzE